MLKKLIAMFTAVCLFTGYSLPAFAEEISVQTEITAADIDSTENGGNAEEISEADTEYDETESTISEDVPDDVSEEDADINGSTEESSDDPEEESAEEERCEPSAEQDVPEEDTSAAPEETQADEEAADTAGSDKTDDTADEVVLEEELELHTPDWCVWDAANGVLTLRGQLPDTYYDGYTVELVSLASRSGISEEAVKKVIITSGTKTGKRAGAMFDSFTNLTEIQGLANLDTSAATEMNSMFFGCKSLRSVDLSHFDTSDVRSMDSMFYDCESLTSIDLSSFRTPWLEDMAGMFDGCKRLTSVDLSGFDTSRVEYMYEMFDDCESLRSVDLSGFDTSQVILMSTIFANCSSLTSVDLSDFDTTNVRNFDCMFFNCSSLTTIKVSEKWKIPADVHTYNMFYNCFNLRGGQGTVWDSNRIEGDRAHIDGGAANPGYLTANVNIPAKPVITSVTPSANYAALKWDAVQGAKTYRIYRIENGKYVFLKEQNTAGYTDTGLKPSTKYGYLVRAFNIAGGSAYTNADIKYTTTLSGTLPKPSFTVTPGNANVSIKWNTVSGASCYRIYRKTGSAVTFLREVTGTSYTDTGLAIGTKYGYLVRAFTGGNNSPYTDADWKYAVPVPAKPSCTAEAGDRCVILRWNAVSGATSYRVYQKRGSSITMLKETTGTVYTDTGLTNGAKYSYLVRAFAGGTGSDYTDSDWKYARPSASAATPKPVFTATAATGSATVSWSAVSGATSYRVYRMEGNSIKFLKEVTSLSYKDTTVKNGTKYGYLVRAFRGAAGSSYTNSDFRYVTPLAKPSVTVTAGTRCRVRHLTEYTVLTAQRSPHWQMSQARPIPHRALPQAESTVSSSAHSAQAAHRTTPAQI